MAELDALSLELAMAQIVPSQDEIEEEMFWLTSQE